MEVFKQMKKHSQPQKKTKHSMMATVEASHKKKHVADWNGGDLVVFFKDLERWKYCHHIEIPAEENNSTKLNFIIGGKMVREYGAGGAAHLVLTSFFLDEIGWQIPPTLVMLWHKDYRKRVADNYEILTDYAKGQLPTITKAVMAQVKAEVGERN